MVTTAIKGDIDQRMTRRQFVRFMEPRLTFLFRFTFPDIGRLKLEAVGVARTVHGWHFVVTVVERIANKELILIQTALGSDYRRELGNLERSATMQGYSWNRLFSEKVNEITVRRKGRFFRLRQLLRLEAYDIKETGRFKTVGKEIFDHQCSKQLHEIIRQAERKPTWN